MALGAGLLAALRPKPSTKSPDQPTSSNPVTQKPPQPQVPSFFLCPITYEIMADPVTLDTGMTYDRASIEEWLENGHNTCPSTNRTLLSHNLIPNLTLQRAIRTWCAANRTSSNLETVTTLLTTITNCTNMSTFNTSAKELYTIAEESGRTRRTLRDAGAIVTLTQALTRLDPGVPRDSCHPKGLEYAVAAIAMLHPSEEEEKNALAVPGMVTILASLLARGSTTAKINAAKVMYPVLGDGRLKSLVGNYWGAIKGVLSLIRDDALSAKETRLGLRCLLALSTPKWNRVVMINERAVHSLVELIPRAEKRCVEYAFAVLEVLANCAEGREAITNHPFAILRIVEYLHGVSYESTEYAVGTLYSVISLGSNRSVIKTALQAGAFTTLLMLLPSDCSARCKTKARETLKLLNENYEGRPGDDDFSIFIERGITNRQQQPNS